jgi:hypothetical protein
VDAFTFVCNRRIMQRTPTATPTIIRRIARVTETPSAAAARCGCARAGAGCPRPGRPGRLGGPAGAEGIAVRGPRQLKVGGDAPGICFCGLGALQCLGSVSKCCTGPAEPISMQDENQMCLLEEIRALISCGGAAKRCAVLGLPQAPVTGDTNYSVFQ